MSVALASMEFTVQLRLTSNLQSILLSQPPQYFDPRTELYHPASFVLIHHIHLFRLKRLRPCTWHK